MALRSFCFLLFFILMGSCTHAPLQLALGECTQTKAVYSDQFSGDVIEYEYSSSWRPARVLISDILAENDLNCSDLIKLNYEVSQRPGDIWLSLLPFYSRGRIKLYLESRYQ